MPLSGSRLNSARYTSILADIQAQFPINSSLLSAEKTALNNAQSAMAHSVADHEGTDVVTEVTTNALVGTTDVVTIPITSPVGTPSVGTGVGTGTVS